jgi:hypothetical protein
MTVSSTFVRAEWLSHVVQALIQSLGRLPNSSANQPPDTTFWEALVLDPFSFASPHLDN